MPDTDSLIAALRSSHDRLSVLLSALDDDGVLRPSYDDGWTIADVASHLGSQAQIFTEWLEAGLSGSPAPGGDQLAPVWESWNSRSPREQVDDCTSANEMFIARVESLPDGQRESFAMDLFGMDLDLPGLVSLRLAEHALHSWDIFVALDPATPVAGDAVALLLDSYPGLLTRAAKPATDPRVVVVETTEPVRRFRLTTGPEVEITDAAPDATADLVLPAEAFIRLVAGRLDPDHTPEGVPGGDLLPALREVFPGL